jgi:hypothetical protein
MTEQLMDNISNEEHERLILISEHAIASPLSTAAQAVLDAYWDDAPLESGARCGLAAALRAVAEQLVPQVYLPVRFYSGENFEEYARQMTRQHLLAIADELEAQ